MTKRIIQTENAPKAIGSYSQAVVIPAEKLVFVSGQIPLDPKSGELVSDDPHRQIRQAFANFLAVVEAAGARPDQIAKLNIYLTDLRYFADVNQIMEEKFAPPFPARAAVQVAALPRQALIEIDGFVCLAP